MKTLILTPELVNALRFLKKELPRKMVKIEKAIRFKKKL